MTTPTKIRMTWLDTGRLIASVSMVGLHASADIKGQPFVDFTPAERIAPMLFRTMIYTARTELFLIISLFLLLMSLDRRPRSYRATIKQQAQRLLLPFLFWTVIFAFYRLIKADVFGYRDAIETQLMNPWSWLSYITLGSVQYHMHFLPTLFGLVLFYPLYKIAIRQPAFGLIVLLCLFCKRQMDVWIWLQFQDQAILPYLIRGVKLLSYAGYGIVAASFYGLVKRDLEPGVKRDLMYLFALVALLLFGIKLVYTHKVILTGHWNYNYDPAYWADFLFPVVLFGLFFSLSSRQWPAVLSRWAPYSFGIYLVHPIFLDLGEIWLWAFMVNPSLYVFCKVIIALFGAIGLTLCLSRLPLLAWTVGLGPLPWRAMRLSSTTSKQG